MPTIVAHSSEVLDVLCTSSPSPPPPPGQPPRGQAYILILLNQPLDEFFPQLWQNATYRVCADGAANRLYDHFHRNSPSSSGSGPASGPGAFLPPHAIVGDLDSMRARVKEHFDRDPEVYLRRDSGQDNTDLEKCIDFVMDQLLPPQSQPPQEASPLAATATDVPASATPTAVVLESASTDGDDAGGRITQWHASIIASQRAALQATLATMAAAAGSTGVSSQSIPLVVYPAFGGRFDQQMSHVHIALKHAIKEQEQQQSHTSASSLVRLSHPLHLLSAGNFARVLLAHQRHVVTLHPRLEAPGRHCGLWPVGADATEVTTRGLTWNLERHPMAWGSGIISTSNLIPTPPTTLDATPLTSDSGAAPATTNTAPTTTTPPPGQVVEVQSDVPLVWWTEVELPEAAAAVKDE